MSETQANRAFRDQRDAVIATATHFKPTGAKQ